MQLARLGGRRKARLSRMFRFVPRERRCYTPAAGAHLCLLLGEHLLLLLDDLGLVFEHEREGQADEEDGGSDDPD